MYFTNVHSTFITYNSWYHEDGHVTRDSNYIGKYRIWYSFMEKNDWRKRLDYNRIRFKNNILAKNWRIKRNARLQVNRNHAYTKHVPDLGFFFSSVKLNFKHPIKLITSVLPKSCKYKTCSRCGIFFFRFNPISNTQYK